MRYDCVIVGSGPAGISAAITTKQRGKKLLVISNEKISSKITKSPSITNYLGYEKILGSDFAQAISKQIDANNIDVEIAHVDVVYSMQDYFAISASYYGTETSTKMFEAKTVIIASGVLFDKPIPGENEFLGKGVSYCATCDALFYKNKDIIVVASSQNEVAEIEYLAEICKTIKLIVTKPKLTIDLNNKNITKVNGTVESIYGDQRFTGAVINGKKIEADGIFILRDNVAPAQLVPGLKISDGHVVVDNNMNTNIAGCFACGDIVGKPYQYIKAAGQGNIAALSAVEFIKKYN